MQTVNSHAKENTVIHEYHVDGVSLQRVQD